jgi:hypothetical protein
MALPLGLFSRGGNGRKTDKGGPEAVIAFTKVLRNNPGLGDSRQKIRVPVPAGKDMGVKMSGNSGSRGTSHIDSHIEPPRPVDLLNDSLAFPQKGGHLGENREREIPHLGSMVQGNDHEMSARVREGIHHHIAKVPSIENQTVTAHTVAGNLAQKATPIIGGTRFSLDIAHSPRGKEVIHRHLLGGSMFSSSLFD